MHIITKYLNNLQKEDRAKFVERCGTSEGYLRKAASIGQRLSERLCIALDRESGGQLRCEDLRSDVDWAYLRGSECVSQLEPDKCSSLGDVPL